MGRLIASGDKACPVRRSGTSISGAGDDTVQLSPAGLSQIRLSETFVNRDPT